MLPKLPPEMTREDKIASLIAERDRLLAGEPPAGWEPYEVRDRLKEIKSGLNRLH